MIRNEGAFNDCQVWIAVLVQILLNHSEDLYLSFMLRLLSKSRQRNIEAGNNHGQQDARPIQEEEFVVPFREDRQHPCKDLSN